MSVIRMGRACYHRHWCGGRPRRACRRSFVRASRRGSPWRWSRG
jgi:hypothetical protein